MRVLVVEDEKKTASFVRKALQAESFAVDVMANGEDALLAAKATPFDVIVLDIMLPGRDGLSVLRQLRERKNTTPVLLLSARGEVNERVEGLNAGADDYLPKPFELAELVARVRALTRRGGENKSIRFARGGFDARHRYPQSPARRNGNRTDRARIPAAGISHALGGAALRAHDDS